jgi:hypothetical protein
VETPVELYPVVKAYPVADATLHGEAVCVAGVTLDEPRQWIRLYPLDFRALPKTQRFEKWQPIRVRVRAPSNDPRPESRTPILDSVEVLGEKVDTDNQTWRRRLRVLEPLMLGSMCELQARQREGRTSLGVFRPATVEDFTVSPVDPRKLASKQALLGQQSFFDEKTKTLVPMPWKCKYSFRCEESECSGHDTSFIDWEVGARWYRAHRRGATGDEVAADLRKGFFEEMCSPQREVAFLTGNMAAHPTAFLILGVIWPRRGQPALFEDP